MAWPETIFNEIRESELPFQSLWREGNPSKLRIRPAPSPGSAAISKPFQLGISTCGAAVCNFRVRHGGIKYVKATDEQAIHSARHSDGRHFREYGPRPGHGQIAGRQSH